MGSSRRRGCCGRPKADSIPADRVLRVVWPALAGWPVDGLHLGRIGAARSVRAAIPRGRRKMADFNRGPLKLAVERIAPGLRSNRTRFLEQPPKEPQSGSCTDKRPLRSNPLSLRQMKAMRAVGTILGEITTFTVEPIIWRSPALSGAARRRSFRGRSRGSSRIKCEVRHEGAAWSIVTI